MQQPQQPGKILRWIKASKWPAKLTGERIGKTNYKRHVLVTVLKNGTADWRNREYEDEKVEFILLEPAEALSAPASPVEEKKCDFCQVPLSRHGTSCGWNNATIAIDANGIIITEGHPLNGKHFSMQPSPVIEIGEQKIKLSKLERNLQTAINEAAAYRAEVAYFINLFDTFPSVDVMANSRFVERIRELLKKYPHPHASHPAPAPIVGEREEEGRKEQSWQRLENALNEAYDSVTNPAPAEQAIPEKIAEWVRVEASGQWEKKGSYSANERNAFIDGCNTMFHRDRDQLGEISLQWFNEKERACKLEYELEQTLNKLEAANEKIKEKQEWINSHL